MISYNDFRIETIGQYRVLSHIKKHFEDNKLELYIVDANTIKAIDRKGEALLFSYDHKDRQVKIH